MFRKAVVAMLLAGGQGSRLGILTKSIAKPGVMYGGKYRIIDFSLSNCINSGIDTVGVLTQYQPLKLNAHIGIGKPWDMDRMNGGITILYPYVKEETGEWYSGTANAVFQNIDYIDKLSPDYVVILSGDHIYKMDYSNMLKFHRKNNAHATISVIKVPQNDASRYGIMNTDKNGKIYEFEEKPQNPKNNLASMGVYIFNWETLKEYLIKDNQDENSKNDFGKNIIPLMLREEKELWAYTFDGYWKDVGTIQAYWESNMDLIARVPDFNLFDSRWKIYSPNPVEPAHYIGGAGSVKKSIIAEGCMIYGKVRNSVIFPGIHIEEGAVIEDSIIMSNCRIGQNAHITKSIICEKVIVGKNVQIGMGKDLPNKNKPEIYNSGISVVGEESIISDNIRVGKNVLIDTNVTGEDFYTTQIESGQSVLKGGVSS